MVCFIVTFLSISRDEFIEYPIYHYYNRGLF